MFTAQCTEFPAAASAAAAAAIAAAAVLNDNGTTVLLLILNTTLSCGAVEQKELRLFQGSCSLERHQQHPG
jgi:hypothetical protein